MIIFYFFVIFFINLCGFSYGGDVYKSIQKIEKNESIPMNLLWSIACVESGKSDRHLPIQPWPWTINVNKKGYFFKNKHDCLKAIKRFIKQGHKSIDVGCMQINLKHHPHAFASLEDAFDIHKNITYGAKFLKSLFKKYKNWTTAIAHYHSSHARHHHFYQKKVLNLWKKSCPYVYLDRSEETKNHQKKNRIFHLFQSLSSNSTKRFSSREKKRYIPLFTSEQHQKRSMIQKKFFPITVAQRHL